MGDQPGSCAAPDTAEPDRSEPIACDSARYHGRMTTHRTGPSERLAELLETLPPEERQQITAWLLDRSPGQLPTFSSARHLASILPAGEGSQLVTLRLPAERHGQLRDWCAEHGFTMAAVVRGLVERFLEEQARIATPQGSQQVTRL